MKECRREVWPFAAFFWGMSALWPAQGRAAWIEESVVSAQRTEFASSSLVDGGVLVSGGRDAQGVVVGTAIRYSNGTWVGAGNLSVARRGHVSIRLTDGRVMVMGGRLSDGQPTSSVEIYDPAANAWQNGPSLLTGRRDHAAAVLSDGRVLVVGGFGPVIQTLPPSEIYDPTSNIWLPTAGQLAGRRQRSILVGLPGGDALILGGNNGSAEIGTVDRFLAATGQWVSQTPMTFARDFFTAFVLDDGRVVAVGGISGSAPVGPSEIFDPQTQQWTVLAGSSPAGESVQSSRLTDGRFLLTGAAPDFKGAWLFNQTAPSWTRVPSLNKARLLHRSAPIPGSGLLVIGGAGADSVESWQGIHFSGFE